MKRHLGLTIIAIVTAFAGFGQVDSTSVQRNRRILFADLPMVLDSSLVYAPSITVSLASGSKLSRTDFLYKGGRLSFSTESEIELSASDSLVVSYKVLDISISQPLQRLSESLLQKADDEVFIAYEFVPDDSQLSLIDTKGLDFQGSFIRGASFGNAQSLVLNSNFNLRFGGVIGDGIEITAAISDQNIPLQPEGNTAQLQDFDKVFIEIKKDNTSLIAGDYELNKPDGYFLNYYKKLLGGNLKWTSKNDKKEKIEAQVSGAFSRGKFARNIVTPFEGNQGPYRLRGNENELFLIVLSGTEKVYIDGKLMTRGLENDYVIDYNRAEVSFTPKRIITKDKRIIIEFEYTDQSYSRTIFTGSTKYGNKDRNVYLNLYSEQDNINSGLASELDTSDIAILRNSGDDPMGTFASGIRELEQFNEFQIAYKLKDSINTCTGDVEEVLIYTTDADSAKYTATFLNIGLGNGNYIQDLNTPANGRVYSYISPDPITCQPRGSFEPSIQLIAPNQKQMMTLGSRFKVNKFISVYAEGALSKNNLNRFSELDSQDDIGWGFKTGVGFSRSLGKEKKDWKVNADFSIEHVQENFQSLNPYRNAEFNRDWNLSRNNTGSTVDSETNPRSNEQIPSLIVSLERPGKVKFEYSSKALLRTAFYEGFQNGLSTALNLKGFNLDLNASLLNSKGSYDETRYEKPNLLVSQKIEKFGNITIGAFGEREWNERKLVNSDTLELNSFGFNEFKIFIKSPEEKNYSTSASYGQRSDFAPLGSRLTQSTLANNIEISGKAKQGEHSNLTLIANVRELQIINKDLTTIDPKNTFLGRIQHHLKLFKGSLNNSLIYELGSGQEPLVEYRYLEVQNGEGLFFWDKINGDFNGDGVPQIDEIQEAAFADQANVIRVSLFTDQFVQTNNVRFNESLRFDPRRLLQGKKGLAKFLSKLTLQSTLQIDRRSRENPVIQVWNPFQISLPDSSLVTLNISSQHTLFYRPFGTKLDLRIGQKVRKGRTLLTSGYDSRKVMEYFTRIRWNINQIWSAGFEGSQEFSEKDVQFFDRQDFDILSWEAKPDLTFRPNQDLRFIGSYAYKTGNNSNPLQLAEANQHELEIETTYNQSSKTSIRLTATASLVDFNGMANSPIELALLDGLKDGQNYLWELSVNRNISDNVLLTINYNGRKTGNSAIVHVGSVQIGARF